jgi:hypothetical protein
MAASGKIKQLWRGIFSYKCSMEPIMYRYAYTKRQAWAVMCREIAKRNDVHVSHVYALFDGSKPNFEISIEMEVKEVANG